MKSSEIIKNFRDVGKSINQIAGKWLFPEHLLYRGGALNNVFSHDEILNIPTIVNLRTGSDNLPFNCQSLHIPAENKMENYKTSNGKIRRWINRVVAQIIDPNVVLPMLIHCSAGKDRTGVIIAVILKVVDIPDEMIIQEYLLSEGVENGEQIQKAILSMGDINKYLYNDYALRLKNKFLGLTQC